MFDQAPIASPIPPTEIIDISLTNITDNVDQSCKFIGTVYDPPRTSRWYQANEYDGPRQLAAWLDKLCRWSLPVAAERAFGR